MDKDLSKEPSKASKRFAWYVSSGDKDIEQLLVVERGK